MVHELTKSNVLTIPLLSDRETTGGRGKPDLDFDILNQLSKENRSHLVSLQNSVQAQTEDISTMLQGVHTTFKSTQQRQRDSNIMFTQQANDLAFKSNQIRQKVMQAAADPFNEIKAFFGDTLSMAEWAAKHNAVQNELSAIKRQYTSSVAGYNFELDQAAGKIQVAQQKLGLTAGNIASIKSFNEALAVQIQTDSLRFTQQLDTMLRPDLVAELKDPSGEIPADMVRKRLFLLDKAEIELKTLRALKVKTQLEKRTALAKFVSTYPELVSTPVLDQAIATGVPVFAPNLGVNIDSQMAKSVKTQQENRLQEDAKLTSTLIENSIEAQQTIGQVARILRNIAGPGVNILIKDDEGRITGFNPEAISAEIRNDVATMSGLQNKSLELQALLVDPNATVDARKEIETLQIEINQRINEVGKKIIEQATKDAQLGLKDKQAKASAAHFVEFNNVINDTGAAELLKASMVSVIDGTSQAILPTAHGVGLGDGLALLGEVYNAEIESVGAFTISEDTSGDITLGGVASGIDPRDLALQTALNKTKTTKTGKVINLIQEAILTPIYELGFNIGIREMIVRHASEPETVAMLNSFILGTRALDFSITKQEDKDGNELDMSLVLFGTFALKEKALIDAGTLPESSRLVQEFQGIMLGDTLEDGKTLYNRPEWRALTSPTTKEGAALSLLFFRNNLNPIAQVGLQQIVQNVPLGTIDISKQITKLEAEFKSLEDKGGLRFITPADEAKRRELNTQIKTLQKQEEERGSGRSLTNTLRILMDQQE